MQYSETSLKSDHNYKEFGKFAINMKLLYENILLAKYKTSYAPIPSIKRQMISKDLVDALIYIFDTGKINYEKIRELSQAENELITNLIMKSGLFDKLKFDKTLTREKIDDVVEEYEILKGEIEADNDNPELIAKAKILLKKLFHYGKITKVQYYEILKEF